MTFEEMLAQLERARAAVPGASESAREAVIDAAVARLGVESPRDTGELAESWERDGTTLRNTAAHASFALPSELVREVLADLDDEFETEFTTRLDAAAGW